MFWCFVSLILLVHYTWFEGVAVELLAAGLFAIAHAVIEAK